MISKLSVLNGKPQVSAVIPLYNAASYVGAAIESVLAQTYPIQEIIVIDDGSTDDPQAALAPYEDKLRYVRIENSGAAHARNLGVSLARSPLIAFLDADDVWVPQKIEKQVARFKALNCALVYCGRHHIDAEGTALAPFDQCEFPQGAILEKLIEVNHISSTSLVLLRKDVFDALGGFNESELLKVSEDFELWCRIAARHPIGAVAEPLIQYRLHEGNSSASTVNSYRGKIAALEFLRNDLLTEGLMDGEIQRTLTARERFTHEHYAWGLLQGQRYADARNAAKALAAFEGEIPLVLWALRWLPSWIVGCAHESKRFASRVLPKQRKA